MKNYFLQKSVLGLLIASMLAPQGLILAATFDPLMVQGQDTVAGYSTVLKTSPTLPRQDLNFQIKKPDGTVLVLPGKTNDQGIAKVELIDYHTRKAGKYLVSASLNQSNENGLISNFRVYPDRVSAEKSTLAISRNVVKADHLDQAYVSVTLADQYNNPYPGHVVHVVSDRSRDTITANNPAGITDQNGTATFTITSNESGVSTFTAIDSTANVVLQQKTQVVFMAQNDLLKDVGGDFGAFLNVAKAAPLETVHHFLISDLPATIQPGQNIGFRVTAQDEKNQTVQNYIGTTHFSAEGANSNNVSLPEDYTFKVEDLGTHQFSLGLSFVMSGSYKIIATDLSNVLVKGDKVVTVGNTQANSQQLDQQKPTIDVPTAGSYSQKTQTISGTTLAGYTIKIFDNAQEIGMVQPDNSGKFTYQTNPLLDGIHKLHVLALDQTQTVKGTADTVQITIDTTPPGADQVDVKPSLNVQAGQVLTIDVLSEENLSQAAIVFNTDITQLNPSLDKPGHYIASVQAPAFAGIYPVDIVLVDQLGNEGSYKSKVQVTVTGNGSNGTDPNGTGNQSTQSLNNSNNGLANGQNQGNGQHGAAIPGGPNPPSVVAGLISYGSDKKVTLVWDAASDNTFVQHYRVYYGFDPSQLDKKVDTKDASTTWYVPGLENGRQYYFALTAVDSEGIESALKSEVSSGLPYMTEVTSLSSANTSGTPGDFVGFDSQNGDFYAYDEFHGAAYSSVPPEVHKTGPELIWLFSGTGVVSFFIQKLRRKRKL